MKISHMMCTLVLAFLPFQAGHGQQLPSVGSWIFKSKSLSPAIYVIGTTHGGLPFPSQIWPRVSSLIQSSQGITIENIIPIDSALKSFPRSPALVGLDDLSVQAQACHARLVDSARSKPNFEQLPLALQAYLGSNYLLPESKAVISVGRPLEYGLERKALLAAYEQGKKIFEIESPNSWLSLFLSTTKDEFDEMILGLRKIAEKRDSANTISESRSRVLTDYLEGDLGSALQSMRVHYERNLGWPSSAFDKFIFGGNSNMADRIRQLASTNRASIFFVGAAHLSGKQGLIALLELEPTD